MKLHGRLKHNSYRKLFEPLESVALEVLVRRNYLSEVEDAVSQKNFETARKVVDSAFEDDASSEVELRDLCLHMLNFAQEQSGRALYLFNERFPESLEPVHGYYACFLTDLGDFEGATEEGRYYLRKLSGTKAFEIPELGRFLSDGIGNAFVSACQAYLNLGALSYAIRIMTLAKSVPALRAGVDHMDQQFIAKWAGLLKEPKHFEVDQKWETFFASGLNVDFAIEECKKRNWQVLARRMDLLEGQHRYGHPLPFEKEFFKIAMFDGPEKNGAMLV